MKQAIYFFGYFFVFILGVCVARSFGELPAIIFAGIWLVGGLIFILLKDMNESDSGFGSGGIYG